MANVRVEWKAPEVDMPEGTKEEHHYYVRLGDDRDGIAELTVNFFVFPDVPNGIYLPSVELVAADHTTIGQRVYGPPVSVGSAGAVKRHLPASVTAVVE